MQIFWPSLLARAAVPMAMLLALATGSALDGSWTAAATASGAEKVEPDPAQAGPSDQPARLVLEEAPEIHQPLGKRTEAEQDRLHALRLFATARALERSKQDEARALRLYQRALRYDPEAATVAQALIPLAHRLERHAEAVRYVLKAIRYKQADPNLLRRLGIYLTQSGNWQQAAALYEQAVAAREGADPDAADVLLRMEMARIYHLAGQYDKAADAFEWVLQALERADEFGINDEVRETLLGDADEAYRLIGDCLLWADKPKRAAALYRRAHRAKPNPGRLGYDLARVADRDGKPEKALAHLQAYFDEKMSSEGFSPYELLADILEKLGQKDELIFRLEKLQTEDPENIPLGYYLAGRYLAAEEYAKAESLCRMLIEASPSVIGYRNLLAIYRKANRTGQLLDVLAEAVSKTSALEPLGEEAETIAKDESLVGDLIELAGKQLEADPDQFDDAHRLAVALMAMRAKRYDEAGRFYELAIEATEDQKDRWLLDWGLGLLRDEQYDAAADVLQRGIDQNLMPEDNPVFYYYQAAAMEMDGRTEEALAAARTAADRDSDSPRYLSRVAWILYHAGRNREAAQVYRELIDRFDPNFESSEVRQVLREARLILSNNHVLEGEIPKAEEYLEQVLDEFPDDIAALNDLGYLWADQNQHLQRAYRMIQKAVEGDPDNAAYRDSLGWILFRLGRVEEAIPELKKAADAEPDPIILDHLGDAYRAVGEPQKALDAWKRAEEAFKEREEIDQAEEVEKKIRQPLTG